MWSEWLARTLKPRPMADMPAAETVSLAPLTLPSLTRWAPPSPTRGEGRNTVLGETPSPLEGEGRVGGSMFATLEL
jgi:hypothetical protein